jgi:hypothetical protein
MPGINHFIENLKAVDFEDVIKGVMSDTQTELVTAQQKQMLSGKTATGGKIGKYKSKSYRKFKFSMNVLAGYGNVDLRLTGEFQRNIKVYFFSRAFFFKSTDEKNQKLTQDYGEDIFGLNDKSSNSYIKETLTPEGRKRIRQMILK